jgi:ABC-type branched-subunit amino acid transport system permease subunit
MHNGTDMTATTASLPLALPDKGPLLTRSGWGSILVALLVISAVAPVLNLWVPADSPFHLSDFMVGLLGKIMCYAICALAMDLIWGYTGILSLGHGLFFALGGYVMGMYLMRQIGNDLPFPRRCWCPGPVQGQVRQLHRRQMGAARQGAVLRQHHAHHWQGVLPSGALHGRRH